MKELQEKHGLSIAVLKLFLPATIDEINKSKIEVHYLGYYLRWTLQEVYYYAIEIQDSKQDHSGHRGLIVNTIVSMIK